LSFDPAHKIIPALVVGKISQEKADLLIERTKEVNDGSLHVFFSDQRPPYQEAILRAFGREFQPERRGRRGRLPKVRLEPPPNLLYVQVVKERRKGRVIRVWTKIVFGGEEALAKYLEDSPVSRHVNTAFVERENGTLRHHSRRLTRRTLAFSKKLACLEEQLHLSLVYYHFCLPHLGLREEITPPQLTKGEGSAKRWRPVTPMMSGGVTDHVWTLPELLTFRVPLKAKENISC